MWLKDAAAGVALVLFVVAAYFAPIIVRAMMETL